MLAICLYGCLISKLRVQKVRGYLTEKEGLFTLKMPILVKEEEEFLQGQEEIF